MVSRDRMSLEKASMLTIDGRLIRIWPAVVRRPRGRLYAAHGAALLANENQAGQQMIHLGSAEQAGSMSMF
jgi:hypothetical protein